MDENSNDKRLKVLLVSPYSEKKVGGIGTWSKSVLDNYDTAKYQIVFQNTANLIKSNIQGGLFRRLFMGAWDSITILVKLFFNLLFKRPSVVHYTSSASIALYKDSIALFITKNIFHKRFIIHWHFGRIPDICQARDGEYKRLMKIIKKADISIVLDRKSLLALQENGVSNVVAIPNPISTAIYDATKSLNIEEVFKNREEKTVLFVGHIVNTKGVLELVRACVSSKIVERLVLVGPVLIDFKSVIQGEANKKGDGTWLEFKGELQREEVYDYYKKCSVFCLPSYTEGFPYVILEAMAFSCPIIATDVGAIAEMLGNESGVIIEPRSEQALSIALLNVLSDKEKCHTMGENAYARVMSTYTNVVIFEQYYRAWREVWD